jgi:diguanylate cyclase (GGDEF)-like protein
MGEYLRKEPSGALSAKASAELEAAFRMWVNGMKERALRFQGGAALVRENGHLIAFYEDDPVGLAGDRQEVLIKEALSRSANPPDIHPDDNTADKLNTAVIPLGLTTERNCDVVLIIFEKGIPNLTGHKQSQDFMSMSIVSYIQIAAARELQQEQQLDREGLERELNRREYFMGITEKLHSQIHVDAVLDEMLAGIRFFFPQLDIEVYLSQDHSNREDVKLLSFQNDAPELCIQAFMEGKFVLNSPGLSLHPGGTLAAPLGGKQGVYGVLQLHSREIGLTEEEVRFIASLAGTAGVAFENAMLYEQSNVLISELRLINEITKRLNRSLKLDEIYGFAASELLQIFGADFSCVLELDKKQGRMIVQATNIPEIYHEDFSLDYGLSGIVYQTKEPLIISDFWIQGRSKSKLMDSTKSRSLIAAPIINQEEVVGVIMVAHAKPNYFSYDNYKLLQVIAIHIGLAMINASLHAELNRMVITDHLTGLHVRHYLDEQINIQQKKDFCGSLIMVDIDRFKQINDTYGHQIGDQILIQVSGIIKTSIRPSDIGARWGGEELAVYLPQVGKEQAHRVAERIRSRVFHETDPRCSVSCGVSDWNWEDEKISVEALFYRADMAMYRAKNEGRNRVIVS